MPSPPGDKATTQLATVRVAKDLFLTDWYRNAVQLLFDAEGAKLLEDVRTETRDERDVLLSLMNEWARRDDPEPTREARRVLQFTRKEFLRDLILAKDAAGEAIEKVALIAPPDLRQRLLELSAIDFRHALRLREQLAREFDSTLRSP